jgi:hypothetical protein
MGALVDEAITELVLRPYRTSETYEALKRTGQGVLHVTDDVELFAQAAVNRIAPLPKVIQAKQVTGFVLADACRWYEFRVSSIEDRSDRATVACRVVERGHLRDFFGFNRAKHAVLEAAILATRLHLLPPDEIRNEFRRLSVPVDKTAGAKERRAFQFLDQYVTEKLKLHAC